MALLDTITSWPGQVWNTLTGLGRRMVGTMAGMVGQSSKPVWPPETDAPRLRRYETNKDLYEGRQKKFFEGLGFKQANPKRPYICVNLLAGMTDLIATRAYGEGFKAVGPSDDEQTQTFIESVLDENRLPMVAFDQALNGIRNGDIAYKVVYDTDAEKLTVQALEPHIVFPEWAALNNDELTAANIDQLLVREGGKKHYLWRERHEMRGAESWVLNKLYRLEKVGQSEPTYHFDPEEDEVPLETLEETAELVPEAPTGIDVLLVVYQRGDSRYTDDLLSLQGEYNQLVTQKSHLFDKHLPATMAGPMPSDEQKDGDSVDLDKMRYLAVEQGATMPVSLLEWSAQGFAAADEHLKAILNGFAFVAGVDAVALVPEPGQVAASGTALRRQQMKTQGTVTALQRYDEPTLQAVLSVCTKLGAIMPLGEEMAKPEPLARVDITIEFQDGLPNDRAEEVAEHVQLVEAGIESKADANKALFGGTDEDAQKRVAEAQGERQANSPPSPFGAFSGAPGAAGGRFQPVTPGTEPPQ